MHDLMYAKDIIKALNDRVNTLTEGSKIISVNAAISPLSHVKPETLAETFKAMVKGTEFENIALNVKTLPLEVKCRVCGHAFKVNGPTTRCIKCNEPDLDILYSKEFTVESIQVK